MGTWHACGGVAQLRLARDLVGESVRDQDVDTRDTAVLLADEWVANALRHGGGEFDLTVRRSPATVRVEVTDRSPRMPIALRADPMSERGRGLAIVSRLSSRWGSDPLPTDGKVVWFELALK